MTVAMNDINNVNKQFQTAVLQLLQSHNKDLVENIICKIIKIINAKRQLYLKF